MAAKPVVIEDFPGLDLRSDEGEGRGALNASNVVFEPGRVRTRPGLTAHATVGSTPHYVGRANRPDSTIHLIVGEEDGTRSAFSADGVLLAESATGTIAERGVTGVNIGTPTASYFYLGGDTVMRWDGTTWTSPAAFAGAPFTGGVGLYILGSTTTDNRMIVCEQETVRFSDPGAPETFATNNYVQLDPGDGENIRGIANFNNQTFIFKRTKFYVFYGQGADGTGEPIFNYRTVNTGLGIQSRSLQAVCAGADGVYFVGPDAIYRTTGGAPQRVSTSLDLLFSGATTPAYYSGGNWDYASDYTRMTWVGSSLYVSQVGFLGVLNTQLDAWATWDLGFVTAMTAYPAFSTTLAPTTLLIGDLQRRVLRLDRGVDTDVGESFAANYRSAFNSFATPYPKRLRQTILEGSGALTWKWSRDWGALTAGSVVDLGATTSTGRQRLAIRGRRFSFEASGTAPWTLNRATANIAETTRSASVTV